MGSYNRGWLPLPSQKYETRWTMTILCLVTVTVSECKTRWTRSILGLVTVTVSECKTKWTKTTLGLVTECDTRWTTTVLGLVIITVSEYETILTKCQNVRPDWPSVRMQEQTDNVTEQMDNVTECKTRWVITILGLTTITLSEWDRDRICFYLQYV